jgi:hypothetical protein
VSFMQSHFSDMADGRAGAADRGRVPSSETTPQQVPASCPTGAGKSKQRDAPTAGAGKSKQGGPSLSSAQIRKDWQVSAGFPRVSISPADVADEQRPPTSRRQADSDAQPPATRPMQSILPPPPHTLETPAADLRGQEGARIGARETPQPGFLSALPDPPPHAPKPAVISQTLLPSGLLGPPMSLPSPPRARVSQCGEEQRQPDGSGQHSWVDGLLDGSRDVGQGGGNANGFGSRVVAKWQPSEFGSSEGDDAWERSGGSGGSGKNAGWEQGAGPSAGAQTGRESHPSAQKGVNRVELWKRLHDEHAMQVRERMRARHERVNEQRRR